MWVIYIFFQVAWINLSAATEAQSAGFTVHTPVSQRWVHKGRGAPTQAPPSQASSNRAAPQASSTL